MPRLTDAVHAAYHVVLGACPATFRGMPAAPGLSLAKAISCLRRGPHPVMRRTAGSSVSSSSNSTSAPSSAKNSRRPSGPRSDSSVSAAAVREPALPAAAEPPPVPPGATPGAPDGRSADTMQ
eukprot:365568-Chlamydomonas_euryale.AAC.3